MKVNTRKNIFKFLIILVILTVIALVIFKVINKGYNNEEGKIIGEVDFGYNPGGIDRNNLENAKIENGKKINVSKKFSKDKQYNGLKITNIKLESNEGVSNFQATVVNETANIYKEEYIILTFVNDKGENIGEVIALISEIQPNSQVAINTAITKDVINAEDFTIKSDK